MAEFERALLNDLNDVTDAVTRRIERKYLKGAEEHGGHGWEMGLTNLSLHAKDEIADASVYLEWLGRGLGELDLLIAETIYSLGRVPSNHHIEVSLGKLAKAQEILRGGKSDGDEG